MSTSAAPSSEVELVDKSPSDVEAGGVSVAVSKEDAATADKPSDTKVAPLHQVFSNATEYDYLLMFLGVLGGVISGVSIPIFNVLFGQILDTLNKDANGFDDAISFLCICFIVVAAANIVSGFLQVYCWSATGERQTQKFRERYVNAILSQEIGWFDTCGASELSTKLAELIGKVQDGMGRKIGDLVQYVTQVVASLAVAFYLNWKITCVLLAAIPVIGCAGAFMINAVTAAQHQSLTQYANAGGLATETLNSIRTVTALNMQPGVITKYRKFLFEAMEVGIKKGLNMGLGNGGVFCACFLTYALGFWYGGNLVADGLESSCTNCLTGGDVMAVFFSTIMGSIALGQIAPPLSAFSSSRAAVATIFETLDRTPLIDGLSEEGLKPEQRISGEIALKAVDFAYPSRPHIQVCKAYDLHIAPGETVALVGQSGCGKSTIINLLLRFYDPQSGAIELDHMDIKALNIKWLRSQIGYVGQEPILFSGTIAENIAYGLNPDFRDALSSLKASHKSVDSVEKNKAAAFDKEALMQQVVAAAKLANAHDFISDFPQGYDTDVGSNGVAMSGGQKQRIAIARALIKKPAVLLLDEATSALDAASERVVQQSIDALAQSKAQTTIIIAHRLSTIRNADKICVIDKGQIAEIGKHDDLVARNGLYADLIRLQLANQPEMEDGGADEGLSGKDLASAGRERKVSDAKAITEAGDVEDNAAVADSLDSSKVASKKKTPAAEEISKEEKSRLWRRVWGYLLKYPALLFVGVFGAAIFGAIFPCWGYLLAHTQEMFYLPDPDEIRARARLYAFYYILLAGVALLSSMGQFYGVMSLGEKVSSTLRSEMFEAIMRRNIAFFDHEENNVGNLTTALADDSRTINKAFGEGLAKQLQAVFTLALALALGLSASWKIALVVLACFPLSIIASAIQMQAISGQQYDTDGAENNQSSAGQQQGSNNADDKDKKAKQAVGHSAMISTAFTNMRTVSAFSMHHKVSEQYSALTLKICEQRVQRSIVAGLGFGGSQAVMFLTYALLFWYGSQLIQDGQVTFVQLMTAILTLMLGALGLGQALADMGDQKAAILIARRIFQNIDDGRNSPIDGLATTGVIPDTNKVTPGTDFARAIGRIELRNVNFVYPTRADVQVCKNYNLCIEPGETVALVGPSGSGKSTIINLLLRFYDPVDGGVFLDGNNVKDLNVRWLRSQIGYVGQEPVLFAGTVEENIARGRSLNINEPLLSLDEAMQKAKEEKAAQLKKQPASSFWSRIFPAQSPQRHEAVSTQEVDLEAAPSAVDEDILEAAKASNAHDFIQAFTQQYATDIGQGSIMVSGGQKQRIAIARALIKKPAVLLLDEATSALDAASERVVQQSIDALAQSKAQTTIIIAHRLSTIRNADKICVIDKGQVVEVGTHDELLQKPDGLYKQLWEKQSGHT